MEKKSYAPKTTKFLQNADGLKQKSCYPVMNCKWCDSKLKENQVYEFLRGKSKGACSSKCSMMILHYGTKENYEKIHTSTCIVCKEKFKRKTHSAGLVCSKKCQSILSSNRMKVHNPMFVEENRKKASDRQKEVNHKPIIQGGNGRGLTIPQMNLYNELCKHDNSFEVELIEKTGKYTLEYKCPRHYKIDIASRIHKLAIEVDGPSHNSLKVKECDERKDKVLNLKGWKVLRLSNSKIQNELESCVQMVLSMI